MKEQRYIEDIKSIVVNKLDTDFRAEVVAAGLIESGLQNDKILIIRQKGDKRHISKDISKVETGFSQQDLMEYLYIYTNRNSIYDAIPENIFHQPFVTAKKKSKEDVINEIRRHREEEFYARRYFQPFEMAVDKLLVDAQLYERKFDKKNFHNNLKDILSGYWSILKLLTLKQAVFFIRIIPVIHKVVTDLELTERLMSVILDIPVKIEQKDLSYIQTDISQKLTKGWRLGVNTVLGSSFKDGYKDLNITIGPDRPERIREFSGGRKDELILRELVAMMLPANTKKNIKYTVLNEFAKFRLSDATHKAYLGINTKL
jgi:hypothetical protein